VAIEKLRESLIAKADSLYKNHLDWADNSQFLRFLIARNFNHQASLDLMIGALKWREHRQPGRIQDQENWESKMSKESETGKIYCPGMDRWERPVLIFDNTVQNTPCLDDHMLFLAWNLEFATKLMPAHIDKYLVFMHLKKFSLFNSPPFSSTKETIHMLCNCFPERLGHCIVYQPPTLFRTFFNTVKGFIDPKTVSKMIFIIGDVSEGSANDVLMKSIIGDNWKELTGAEQPVHKTGSSPGYVHDTFWPTVKERLELLQPVACSTPPSTPTSPADVEEVEADSKVPAAEADPTDASNQI
jgi:hypothetical protein